MQTADFGVLFAERFPRAPEEDRQAARSIGVLDLDKPDDAAYEAACRLYLKNLPPAELQRLIPACSPRWDHVEADVFRRDDILAKWGFFRGMERAEQMRGRFWLLGSPFPYLGHFLAALEWYLLAEDGVVPRELARRYGEFVETVLFARADSGGLAPIAPRMWVELGKFQYKNPFDIFERRYAGAFEHYDSLDDLTGRCPFQAGDRDALLRLRRLYPDRAFLSVGETVRHAIDYIQSGGRAAHIVRRWLCRAIPEMFGEKTCEESAFFRGVSSFASSDIALFSGEWRPEAGLTAGAKVPLRLTDCRGMPFRPVATVRQVCCYGTQDEVRATAWHHNTMWLLRMVLNRQDPSRDRVLRYALSQREPPAGHLISFRVRAGNYPHRLGDIRPGAAYEVCLIDLWGRDVPLRAEVCRVLASGFEARAGFPDGVSREFCVRFSPGSAVPADDIAEMRKDSGYLDIPYDDWPAYWGPESPR